MKNTILISALSAALALSSCVSHKMGEENIAKTDVRLEQANYRVIATQVKGESTGFHLLSAIPTSIPTSLADLEKFAKLSPEGGITIKDSTKARAIENLYKNCGDLRNRPTALINIREETGGTNYFISSRPKTTITADVIEFTHWDSQLVKQISKAAGVEIHPRRFFRPLIPTAVAEAIYVSDRAHVDYILLLP